MKVSVDKLGAVASTICAVHCALTGLALGLLSVLGLGFIGSGITEVVFIGIALLLGVVAVIHGIKKHHSYVPALVFLAALGFLVTSHLVFGHQHDGHGHWSLGATLFSVLGGLSLVAFHWLNLRLASHCGCQHCRTGH